MSCDSGTSDTGILLQIVAQAPGVFLDRSRVVLHLSASHDLVAMVPEGR